MFDLASAPKLHRRWHTPCFDDLGKLAWPCWFSVTCFGVRIGVRTNDSELLETLRGLLPAGCRPYRGGLVDHYFSAILGGSAEGSRIRKLNLLYRNHQRLARSSRLDQVLDAFESGVRFAVASLAPRHTFVHAGVVGWKGRAILIPGRSLSGKTTLTAELVRAGASYLSDEYAVLGEDGRVHPFAKPLSLRASPTARQVETPVEALGGEAARRPLPAGLVVLTTYKDGARWRPRSVSAGMGALAMLGRTLNGRNSPERAISSISHVVAHAPVVKTSRGDAAEVAPLILRLLERRAGL